MQGCSSCGRVPIAETPKALSNSLGGSASTYSVAHGIKNVSNRGANGVPGIRLDMKSEKSLAWVRAAAPFNASDIPEKVTSKLWVNIACDSLVVDADGKVGGALAEQYVANGGQAYIGIVGSPSAFAGDGYAKRAQELVKANPSMTGAQLADKMTREAWGSKPGMEQDRQARLDAGKNEATAGMGRSSISAIAPAKSPQFFCYGPGCDLPLGQVIDGKAQGEDQRPGDRPYPSL